MKKIIFLLLLTSFLSFNLRGYSAYPSWTVSQRNLFGNIVLMEKKLIEYIKIADQNKSKYEPQWRVSELTYYLWENYMFKKDYKKCFDIIKVGYKYGKRALKIKPNGKEALFWFSANVGIYGLLKGPTNVLQLAPQGRKLLEKLSVVDPKMTFEKGSWARILGKIYAFIPSFPISFGNIEKGIYLLNKTVAAYPNYGINWNFLGEAYLVKGEIFKAKSLFEKNILMLKNSDQTIYANRRDLRISKTLLKLTKKYILEGKTHISYSVLSKEEYN